MTAAHAMDIRLVLWQTAVQRAQRATAQREVGSKVSDSIGYHGLKNGMKALDCRGFYLWWSGTRGILDVW